MSETGTACHEKTASPVVSARAGKTTVADLPASRVTVSEVPAMARQTGVPVVAWALKVIFHEPEKADAFCTSTCGLMVSD